ncbi:hypothetical protein [Vibrio parahaemolyticus]|uniref:hypothetical protein n=1 Tax=Vibrio parahaemolyticus TaxID=670 RepID=UPI001121027C|nr:hypothetical protein [Vibrio parahaemolyticus]MBE4071265.1 hypothetical protein [Vibrio parahaemolyticus]MDG2594831.1 hypothetical protein [Vibrio parahaemolyticus]TOK15450.1 hypothetical protein CGI24_24110 [Vibrio parahaemolyticus]
MYEWLNEAFSAPTDRARFIAIMVSAVVAILVLLLNQWFTNRRERRNLLIGKIEEMYSVSIDYSNAANQILKDLSNPDKRDDQGYYIIDQVVYGNMNDAIRKIEMLCGLYFPDEHFKVSDYSINNMPIVGVAVKGKIHTEEEAFLVYEQSRDHVVKAERQLADLCRSLMRKYA